jgi:hypothetical protein
MSIPDEYKKTYNNNQLTTDKTDGDESDGSETGGRDGRVAFREFVGVEHHRDDLLPPDERKRLLIVHKQVNEQSVKKQKERRDLYKELKEGKTQLKEFRQGLADSRNERGYKPHAILANKAQFSGMDRQVNTLPNENSAETNDEQREELQYQYNLQYRPQYANAPKAAPKPSPFNR